MRHMLPLCMSILVILCCAGPSQAQSTCTLTLTTTDNVTLGWDNTPQPSDITVLGLSLERQVNGRAWHALPLLPPDTTRYQDNTLKFGNTYLYRLRVKGRLADNTVTFSGYATEGTPPPCVKRVHHF